MRKIIILIIILLLLLLGLILVRLYYPQGEIVENTPLINFRQSEEELRVAERDVIVNDREVLLSILEEELISNNTYAIGYFKSTNSIEVRIFEGDRQEVIEEVYEYLKGRGIKEPQKLGLQFLGPFTYEDYFEPSDEFLDEVYKKYNPETETTN